MNPDPFWRYREFLAERDRDRQADRVPRPPRHLQQRLRARLAQALLSIAAWLSPDIRQPAPALKLARATRRNGTV